MSRRIVHIAKTTGIYGMEKHLLALLPADVAADMRRRVVDG